VVKSQIHAGGRGKGKFKELGPDAKGGVRLAFSIDEVQGACQGNARQHAGDQADRRRRQAGQPPLHRRRRRHRARAYLSILVDRTVGRSGLRGVHRRRHGHRGSRRGNAGEDHHARHRSHDTGVTDAPICQAQRALELSGAAAKDGEKLFPILYKAFVEKDMALLEINPLIVMKDGHLRVLDAKVSFDGNALFRHDDIVSCAT
jgi:succinyl-CoA synthetase beta subunit